MSRLSGLITVGWYLHPIEAQIARGLLESEGIPAFLHSIHHSSIDWSITLALGGIRLQVPAGTADLAIEILRSVEGNFDDEEVSCPECKSRDTVESQLSWQIALFVVHIFHIPVPFRRYLCKCKRCGNAWH